MITERFKAKERLKEIKRITELKPFYYNYEYLEDRYDLCFATINRFVIQNNLKIGNTEPPELIRAHTYIKRVHKTMTAYGMARHLNTTTCFVRNVCTRMGVIPFGSRNKELILPRPKKFFDYDRMINPIL